MESLELAVALVAFYLSSSSDLMVESCEAGACLKPHMPCGGRDRSCAPRTTCPLVQEYQDLCQIRQTNFRERSEERGRASGRCPLQPWRPSRPTVSSSDKHSRGMNIPFDVAGKGRRRRTHPHYGPGPFPPGLCAAVSIDDLSLSRSVQTCP
jgi:hypothetical protein